MISYHAHFISVVGEKKRNEWRLRVAFACVGYVENETGFDP